MKNVSIVFFLLVTFNTTAQNNIVWAEEVTYDLQFEKDKNNPEVVFANLDNIGATPIVSNYKTLIDYLYQEANEGNLHLFDTDDLGRMNKTKSLSPEQLKTKETRRDTIFVEDAETGKFYPTYVDTRLNLKNYKAVYLTQHWAFNPSSSGIDVSHPNILFAKEVIDELTGEFRGYMPVFYIDQNYPEASSSLDNWSSTMHFGTFNGGNDNLQYLSAQGGKPYPVYTEQLTGESDVTLIDELFEAMDSGKLKAYSDAQGKAELKQGEMQKIFGQTSKVDVVDLNQQTRKEHQLYTNLCPAVIKGLRVKQSLFFDATTQQLNSKITAVAFLNAEQQPMAWLKLQE